MKSIKDSKFTLAKKIKTQDVEIAVDEELKKNTPNTKTRVMPKNNVQNNVNHIRNKQLY